MEPLHELGFDVVGYGCTTCIGNSGPLAPEISEAIDHGDLSVCVGALGQPQLRGPHPSRLPHELPRVAAARRRVRARGHDGRRPRAPIRSATTRTARRCTCAISGRRRPRSPSVVGVGARPRDVRGELRARSSTATSTGARCPRPTGDRYEWDPESTYIRRPPFLEGITADGARAARHRRRARARAARRQRHHRPHLARGRRSGATARRASGCSSTASSRATSTPTARGAAITR